MIQIVLIILLILIATPTIAETLMFTPNPLTGDPVSDAVQHNIYYGTRSTPDYGTKVILPMPERTWPIPEEVFTMPDVCFFCAAENINGEESVYEQLCIEDMPSRADGLDIVGIKDVIYILQVLSGLRR